MIKKILKKYKCLPHIFVFTLVSLAGIGFLFFYFYPSRELLQAATSGGEMAEITAAKYISALDGKLVNKKTDSIAQVVGVMIDNHPDARPESGVAKAKIVYEAPVEGGLTRYMAIFDSKQAVNEVGPVRSARAYFLDWLQEYGNGLYMHSGGSPEALDLIKSRKIFDANEFFLGDSYWRDLGKQSPHNLYTNSDSWQKIVNKYGDANSLFTTDKAWKYARSLGKTIGQNNELKIPYSPYYLVGWSYNAKSLMYTRTINGDKEIDRDGSQVTARNILVQITSVSDIANDDKGRQAVVTVGSGEAMILKKGSVIYGTWKKTSLTSRTRFYGKDGKEVILAPGNTWVEVVPKEISVLVIN